MSDARARISEGTSEHHVDPYAFATLGMWMLLHDLAPRFTLAWYVHGQVTTGEMVARWNMLSRLYRALRDAPVRLSEAS